MKRTQFSADMVNALLEKRKNQTRRLPSKRDVVEAEASGDPASYLLKCAEKKWGAPGTLIAVSEPWAVDSYWDDFGPADIRYQASAPNNLFGLPRVHYLADGPKPSGYGKTRPAMFMCLDLSRLTIRVKGIRVERLQDISDSDALNEGILVHYLRGIGHTGCKDYMRDDCYFINAGMEVKSYESLWRKINPNPGYGSWVSNPWVLILDFNSVDLNLDRKYQERV